MTNALRESLARHAHAVEPPALDVHALVSAGEKRLRRRRFSAVAGSVLAVALAAGVPAVVWQLGDEPRSVEQPKPSVPSISTLQPETAREMQDRLKSYKSQGPAAPRVDPGTYVVDVDGLRPRPVVELPEGFHFDTVTEMAAFTRFGISDCTFGDLACPWTRDERKPGGDLKVGFWNGEQIKVHPELCGKFKDFTRPGPSVGDLASTLAGLPGFRASGPTFVSLGGYDGLYVELVAVAPPCPAFWLTSRTTGLADDVVRGHVERLWVLQVEGGRVVVEASHDPGATEGQVAELTRIVESVTFDHTE